MCWLIYFIATFTVVYENLNFSPESFIVKSNSFESMISRSGKNNMIKTCSPEVRIMGKKMSGSSWLSHSMMVLQYLPQR